MCQLLIFLKDTKALIKEEKVKRMTLPEIPTTCQAVG